MPRSGMARWKGSCIRTFITYCPIPSVFVVVFCTTSNLGDYLFPPGLPSGMHVCMLSPFSSVRLFVTLWTVACQASLFMGFSRQEYWSGLPCPLPGSWPGDRTCISYISWVGRQILYQYCHLESAPHPSDIHKVKHLDLVQSVGKKWWSWCSFNLHFFYCKWERTSFHYILKPIICHLCFITFWEVGFSLFKV